MSLFLDFCDERGELPDNTEKSMSFLSPSQAKNAFKKYKQAFEIQDENCEFVLGLQDRGSLIDMFCTNVKGFEKILNHKPESYAFYSRLKDPQHVPALAEQRNLRAICNLLHRASPAHEFNDHSIVDEMVISSGVRDFARCSHCNMPVHISDKDDHSCFHCHKENLCNHCLISHDCAHA